jgi:formylmethanofuran dehydrogenase subunit B
LKTFAERLRSCRCGVVFFGLGLSRGRTGHRDVESLLRLVTDLNRHTRFYARRMRVLGDVAGADSVLCWQTGYPFSVNLARGYPRYNPGEYSVNDVLRRGEVDACVLVGSESVAQLEPRAIARLRTLPVISLDYPGNDSPWPSNVAFTTAIYGVHEPGTAYRMDEVPIPLRRFLATTYPSDHAVLNAIESRLSPAVP